jgi:hypothetical protein
MKNLPADIQQWPAEWRYRYEERAGIMEFDGNADRATAELEAELCCRAEHAEECEVSGE